MIISFANQKGGCGKSSLALLLGAYLVKNKNRKVVGIDIDKQRSFLGRYDKDKSLTENPLYEVNYYKPIELISLIRNEELDKDTIYIVDTPNQLDKEVLAVLVLSDKLIVPYNYSRVSMESTTTFMNVISQICDSNKKLMFVANNIISKVKMETIEEYQNILEKFTQSNCVVKNVVKSSINIQRFDTLNIPSQLLESNIEVLEEIFIKLSS